MKNRRLSDNELAVVGAGQYGGTYTSGDGSTQTITQTYFMGVDFNQGLAVYTYQDYGLNGEFVGAYTSFAPNLNGDIWNGPGPWGY